MKVKASILLVEDDSNLGFVLQDFLTYSGYKVDWHEDGQSATEAFNKGEYDLVLLDIMLPTVDGFTVAEDIKKINASVPIIFLTARSQKEDKIHGFKLGADDYITKPFSTEELRLRIEAVLRRTRSALGHSEVNVFEMGLYTFDYPNQLLSSPDSETRLTRKEAEVLRLLCLNPNQVLRREYALKTIWGDDNYFMGRSMDVYITKLRKLLAKDAQLAITNIPRTGFMLEIKQA